jgi:hypothetical protein
VWHLSREWQTASEADIAKHYGNLRQNMRGDRDAPVEECQHFAARLLQELCRAAERRLVTKFSLPEDQVPVSSDVDAFDALADNDRFQRPAHKRDHLFRTWKADGLGPARIVDRWNGMTDSERRSVCPRKWQRIESAGGREGARDLVEKALKKAEEELRGTRGK